jgi:hypothetical protein
MTSDPWQPMSAFPEIAPLARHDEWLAARDVSVQRVWTRVAPDRTRYTGYLLRRTRSKRMLLIVMQAGRESPAYLRLYEHDDEARADSETLADEMLVQPPRIGPAQADAGRGAWCARVVERQHHCELQIIPHGLIPQTTRIFRDAKEAELQLEELTTKHHHHRHWRP